VILGKDLVLLLLGNVASGWPGAKDLKETYEESMPFLGSAEEGSGFNAFKHSYVV